MAGSFFQAFFSEINQIKNSFYRLGLISIFPILCFWIIVAIFDKGVPRELGIAVVDNDHTKTSRELLFKIESSPTLHISHEPSSTKDAIELLKSADVYGVIYIPKDFAKDVTLGLKPKVTAMINTQYILIGKIITSAIVAVTSFDAVMLDVAKKLPKSKMIGMAIMEANPVSMQITPFFNTYQNYFLFLVSALLPAIWQIFIVVATIVSFGSMFKAKQDREFYNNKDIVIKTFGKLMPNTIAFITLGVLILYYIYGVRSWAFEGSFAVMFLAVVLSVFAYEAVALLLLGFVRFDYARALSMGAVYSAPAFAFIGITFPIYNMNSFALFWRDLLPLSYYMEIEIAQANYATPFIYLTDKFLYLFAFNLSFVLFYFLLKRRLER